MPKDSTTNHPSHAPELKKLNRIAGQVEGIKKMIENRRYCVDILTQIRAARAALKSVETNVLERHIGMCVAESFANPKTSAAKIDELKKLLKKFDGG